ncbi:TRM11 family SAM-dependent methyltransferase [Propionibacteriaceae bacterium Y1923]|uniref:TRM11 family SAM-dependent methyltransferase n=1 Tax=Aestuariimicrobium sp. Y1814 TaxID=3418742 RepID=UPI003C2124D8
MGSYLVLLAPSANRVYAGAADVLAAAELEITHPGTVSVEPTVLAGVEYLALEADRVDPAVVAGQSASLALFERLGELLRPLELANPDWLDDDLVTIQKYPGKTNEQFTRLLTNVTLAAVRREPGPREVLDPLAGRGTTLLTAWSMGHDGFGVEADPKAVEAMSAFLKTYLRRKRYKHTAATTPVRREGRAIGKRFDATLRLPDRRELVLATFTGDARDSGALWGRRKFDAIITDAPYGVVHGASQAGGKRDRSPAGLLAEAVPVWAGQLRPGGALGLSWNTHGLTRENLASMMAAEGLEVMDEGPWLRFSHRVDSAIQRDLMVGVKPL